MTESAPAQQLSGGRRTRFKLGAGTAATISVLVVVCGTVVAAALLGHSEPLGEPPYSGSLIANDVALSQVKATSLHEAMAVEAAGAILKFQALPVAAVTFAYPFYVAVFCVFLAYGLIRRDWRALLVGTPQIAIFALSVANPSHATLAFVIPAIAAQIMFFGALTRNTRVIGVPPTNEASQ